MDITEAILAGNTEELRKALSVKRPYLNTAIDENENTPLHIAVKEGQIEMVGILVNAGAQVNFQNAIGDTPLHTAVKERVDNAIIQKLINKNANLEAKNSENETPLHLAVWTRSPASPEITKLLVKNGANVNARGAEFDGTPLHSAIRDNNDDFVDDSLKIVQILLNGGADLHGIDFSGETPLHASAYSNLVEPAQKFIDAGANINATDNELNTPLHTAAQNYNVMKVLINEGANISAANILGETPLHLAVKYAEEDSLACLRLLVNKGGDVNAPDADNDTPLQLMENHNNQDIADFAREITAEINASQILQNELQRQTGLNDNTMVNVQKALSTVQSTYFKVTPPELVQEPAQNQNLQGMGRMAIPRNQVAVANNNDNTARPNVRERENDQNEVRNVRPRRG